MIPKKIALIKKTVSVDTNGFEVGSETRREVYAEELSVTGREFYAALAAGISVDCLFRVRSAFYSGEPMLETAGVVYAVVRSYNKGEWTELTARRVS